MAKPATNSDPSSQSDKLLALTTLLMLEQEAREKNDLSLLAFVMVNETYRLIPYRQCAFWQLGHNKKVFMSSISGLSEYDADSPFVNWLERLIQANIQGQEPEKRVFPLSQKDLDTDDQKNWDEWLSSYASLVIFRKPDETIMGGLLLERDQAFTEGDINLLHQLSGAYEHCFYHVKYSRKGGLGDFFSEITPRFVQIFILLAFMAAMIFPVRLSVTAPAEVIAQDPYVVSAPMEGVIQDILVEPNQAVKKGDLLFRLDDTVLKNKVEITQKELAITQANYEKTLWQAHSNPAKKAELDILKANIEANKAELSYTKALLEKTGVRAERDGTAIFSDPNALRGAPVRTGQRAMLIANPSATELLVRVPVDALIKTDSLVPVRLFLNIAPLDMIEAEIKNISYEATPDPDGLVTYKLKAKFKDQKNKPRVGLKGTARVYGDHTFFGYQILRRPFITLRQIAGI